jgi:hypothetical protein
MHCFFKVKRKGIDYLKKQRQFSYVSECLAKDHPFEGCSVDTEPMVMCQAYRENKVVFRNLPKDHINLLDDSIKHQVDENIRWVLATPIWENNNFSKPVGVVVIFSSKEIAKDGDKKIKDLEQIGIELATIISNIIFQY